MQVITSHDISSRSLLTRNQCDLTWKKPNFAGGDLGLRGLLGSPGTGSGTAAYSGCSVGLMVSRNDKFASVKLFALPDGDGPCRFNGSVKGSLALL